MKNLRNIEVYYNSLSSIHLYYRNERTGYYLIIEQVSDTQWSYTVFNLHPTFEEAKVELDAVLKTLHPSDIRSGEHTSELQSRI